MKNTSNKLDKKIKNKWIKALRSGKYKQTRVGTLYNKDSDAYCCLGVLQKCLTGKVESGDTPSTRWYAANGLTCIKWGKINNRGDTIEERLISLNDFAHKSFSYIAGWIDKNL
jgi:hypothetical protein